VLITLPLKIAFMQFWFCIERIVYFGFEHVSELRDRWAFGGLLFETVKDEA
jgi:hypothetical protein